MKLGNFWGMTAPMFVLAFRDREEPLVFFEAMRKHSDSESLRGLQKELVALSRIERLVVYKNDIDTLSMAGDCACIGGSLVGKSEYSGVFRSEVLQRVLVKCAEREKRLKYKDLEYLERTVNEALTSWRGSVAGVQKLVTSVVQSLPECSSPCVASFVEKNGIKLCTSITDTVMTENGTRTLTEYEKSVCEYFVSRLPDVRYWIEQLSVTSAHQEMVWGVPFFRLVKRKPESLYYTVLTQFEQIKNVNNKKTLMDRVARVRSDAIRMKKLYQQYVWVGENTVTDRASIEFPDRETSEFFDWVRHEYGFSIESLTEDDRDLLFGIFRFCERLMPEAVLSTLGIQHDADVSALGKDLCDLGIYGINGMQKRLFAEAIANTVLSPNRVFVEKEVAEAVLRILENDIEAALDSIIPVGEVLE